MPTSPSDGLKDDTGQMRWYSGAYVTGSTAFKKYGAGCAYALIHTSGYRDIITMYEAVNTLNFNETSWNFGFWFYFDPVSGAEISQNSLSFGADGLVSIVMQLSNSPGDNPRVWYYVPWNVSAYVYWSPLYDSWNGAWHHVAMSRNGSLYQFWFDGVVVGSVTKTVSFNQTYWFMLRASRNAGMYGTCGLYIDDAYVDLGNSTVDTTEKFSGGAQIREYTLQFGENFGNQNSAYILTPSTPIDDISKLNSFTLEVMFRPDMLFEPVSGDADLRYNLVGQFQQIDNMDTSLTKNWWALEYITDDAGDTYYRFRVYDMETNSYLIDIYYEVTIPWESSYDSGHIKRNTTSLFDHVAVVKSGDTITLYVNGDKSATSEGTLLPGWDTINMPWQLNGQQAYRVPNLPHATTQLKEFRFLNYALYTSEFTRLESFLYVSENQIVRTGL